MDVGNAAYAQPPLLVEGAVWIPLANGPLTLVDESDFPQVSRHLWRVAKGYAVRTTSNGHMLSLHREILCPPIGVEVDHQNGDRLDNRRSNLRLATRAQNAKNTPRPASNTSGAKGVTWDNARNRWKVQIRIKGQRIWLGRFTEYSAAIDAYRSAAEAHHGEFACVDDR